MVDWLVAMWAWIQTNWAGVVATAAVVITVQQLIQQRRHDRLSVQPVIDFHLNSSDAELSFVVRNKGLGPALLKNFEISFDNTTRSDVNWHWLEVIQRSVPGRGKLNYTASVPQWIPEGDEVVLFRLEPADGVTPDAIQTQFALNVQVNTSYTSIYDQEPRHAYFDGRRRFTPTVPKNTQNDVSTRPTVPYADYWITGPILLVAFLCPVVAFAIWGLGDEFSRSGSLTVGLTIAAEFGLRIRADTKHVANAFRAAGKGERPLDFSTSHQLLSLIAIVWVLAGTVVWGFGDMGHAPV